MNQKVIHMDQTEITRAYTDRCLVFYGSRVNTLPYRIFALYKVLTTAYADPSCRLPEMTKGSALYDEEEKFYRFRGEDGTETDLTRSDTVLWASLFQDPEGRGKIFVFGMGRQDFSRRPFEAPCQIAVRADDLSARTYRILKKYKSANPAKYTLPSVHTMDPGDHAREELIFSPACPGCNAFSYCSHTLCTDVGRCALLAGPLKDRQMRNRDRLEKCASPIERIAVLDFEMQDDYPMQFAGLILEWNGLVYEIKKELNMYIALPEGVNISPYVSRLTGIGRDLLEKKGIPEMNAALQIDDFLSGVSAICGQTPVRDFELLHLIYERNRLPKPLPLQSGKYIDVAILLQCLYDNAQLLSLEKEAAVMGLSREKGRFHNAVTDTAVTASLFIRLFPLYALSYGQTPLFDLAMAQKARCPLLLEQLPGNTLPSENQEARKEKRIPAPEKLSGSRRSSKYPSPARTSGRQDRPVRTRRQG
jgi:DNA polymerase III epsilon subunit-like protein